MVVATAFIIWNTLKIITYTESPIVVVLSGSMEPGFYRGDLLFLYHLDSGFDLGEIVVYKLPGREIPIVHRVLQVREREDGDYDILTKGDNNKGHDRGLYDYNQRYLNKEHIIGRVKGYVPYVGMVTILMNDYPWLKWIFILTLATVVIANRENS